MNSKKNDQKSNLSSKPLSEFLSILWFMSKFYSNRFHWIPEWHSYYMVWVGDHNMNDVILNTHSYLQLIDCLCVLRLNRILNSINNTKKKMLDDDIHIK